MTKQEFLVKQHDLEKKIFLEKYGLKELMFDTNTDFKYMLLSNLSDIELTGDITKINNIKRFIIDFFETQKKHQELNWK